jgi:hypothetical protein
VKGNLLQEFLDAGIPDAEPIREVTGISVSEEDIGNLATMFDHPGYATYRRLLLAHCEIAVQDTMGSATETTKAQYDVAKGIRTLANELLSYPELIRKEQESIQRNAKLRKKD